MMRILIAAGGSGGHIFPAVALARTLKEKDGSLNIKFVGSNKALDRRIFEKEGFGYSLLSANKLPYKLTPQVILFFVRSAFDLVRSFFIIVSYRPDVVIGFGGYVSCHIIFFAYLFRIPKIVHEQNAVPGRANKILFRLADSIAISFEETRRYIGGPDRKKIIFTGNPIRPEMFGADRAHAIKSFGLEEGKFTILVIGGSQGAHFLNETFINTLSTFDERIRSSLQVIHLTGLKDYEWALGAYGGLGLVNRVYSFIDRIEEAYSASDLVITRSGASAIFEIASFGKPMILVPYPFAMSHQSENARVFSEKGAAIEIEERVLTARTFKDNILGLLNDRSRLNKLAESAKGLSVPEASGRLAGQVLRMDKRQHGIE